MHRGILLSPEKEGDPDTCTAWMDLNTRCSGTEADTQGHTRWDLFIGNPQNRQIHRQTWICGCQRLGGVGRPAHGRGSPLGDGMFWNQIEAVFAQNENVLNASEFYTLKG